MVLASDNRLAGSRILITRPDHQGEALMKKLSAHSAEVVHYPVLEIAPLALEHPSRETTKQLILNLDYYHHVIFISTNAVQYGADFLEQYWPQWPVGIAWYAIGMATAKAMMDRGINASAPTMAMNSEALLELMDLQHIAGQKVLIIRGVGGRDYLAEQLRGKGAQVDYAECYQRQCPLKPTGELAAIIEAKQINHVCVNSGESLLNFVALVGEHVLQQLQQTIKVLVPGERVAQIAKDEGFQHILVAENASDDACVAALINDSARAAL